MKRKITVLIAILAAVCLVLTACASENTQTAGGTNVSSSDTNKEADPRCITLSGDPKDSFVAEDDCYTESEDVVLYFQKGVTVKGDMLAITEEIMDDICGFTGLDFGDNCEYNEYCEFRNMYFEDEWYEDINEGADKINVMIVCNPENYAVECAFDNGVILDERDYDFEETGYQIIYHELAHVIHLRNAADISSTMDEGYAEYVGYMTLRSKKLPSWSHIQYFDPYDYDDSVISKGQDGFMCLYPERIDGYHYGFRFVMFLEETYGEGIFIKIADEAESMGFDSSYDPDNQEESLKEDTDMLVQAIIAQTEEDVFEKFADWNEDKWDDRYQEYKDYMNSVGEVIDW